MIRNTTFTVLCLLSLALYGTENSNNETIQDNQARENSSDREIPLDNGISSQIYEENLKTIAQEPEQELEQQTFEIVELTDTAIPEKDLEKFPIEEELFNQDPFSELGFDDADMESLDEILKNQNFEPQPPSKLIRFLSKGYPLFTYVMQCKRSFATKCITLQKKITVSMKALRKKLSCS